MLDMLHILHYNTLISKQLRTQMALIYTRPPYKIIKRNVIRGFAKAKVPQYVIDNTAIYDHMSNAYEIYITAIISGRASRMINSIFSGIIKRTRKTFIASMAVHKTITLTYPTIVDGKLVHIRKWYDINTYQETKCEVN